MYNSYTFRNITYMRPSLSAIKVGVRNDETMENIAQPRNEGLRRNYWFR